MEAGVDNFSLAFSCFDGVRNEIQFDIRIRAIATLITLKHQKEQSIIITKHSCQQRVPQRSAKPQLSHSAAKLSSNMPPQ